MVRTVTERRRQSIEAARMFLELCCTDYLEQFDRGREIKYGLINHDFESVSEQAVRYLDSHPDRKIKEIIGERPEKKMQPSEADSRYRRRMTKYIRDNTGIGLPVSSLIPARFYDCVADSLGL